MRSTPLHLALGAEDEPLSWTLVLRACEQQVVERGDLDWKAKLPLPTAGPRPAEAEEELAKDIAAMANSGGGLIVYGVRERRTEAGSEASEVEPIGVVDEATLKTIRQVAANLVAPPVTGVEFALLAPEGDPAGGALAMLVPDSPDGPHLVHPKRSDRHWFVAPYRDGPDTAFMVDQQIASAYRERAARRRLEQQSLDQLYAGFCRRAGGGASPPCWVVAVAAPVRPIANRRTVTQARAHTWFTAASRLPWVASWGALVEVQDVDTSRGLRHWHRSRVRTVPALNGARIRARVEIHADGSVAAGLTTSGAIAPGDVGVSDVPVDQLEKIGLDLLALADLVSNRAGSSSDYAARLGVTPPTQVFRLPDTLSPHYQPFDEASRVLVFPPVDGLLPRSLGLREFLAGGVDLIGDAMNQAGTFTTLTTDELWTSAQAE